MERERNKIGGKMIKRIFLLSMCVVFVLVIGGVRVQPVSQNTIKAIQNADAFQLSKAYIYKDRAVLIGNKDKVGASLFAYRGQYLINQSNQYVDGIQNGSMVQTPIQDGFYLDSSYGINPNWYQIDVNAGTVKGINRKVIVQQIVNALSKKYSVTVNATNSLQISDMNVVGNWVSFWLVNNTGDVISYSGYYNINTGVIVPADNPAMADYEGKDGTLYVFSQNVDENTDSFFTYTVSKYDRNGNVTSATLPSLDDLFMFDVLSISLDGKTIIVKSQSSGNVVVLTQQNDGTFQSTVIPVSVINWTTDANGVVWALIDENNNRYVERLDGTVFTQVYQVLPTMDCLFVYDQNNLVVGEQYGTNVTRIVNGAYVPLSFQLIKAPPKPFLNKVTTKTTLLTGGTSANVTVYITIGGKTYTVSANNKGQFSKQITKQPKNTIIQVYVKNQVGKTSPTLSVKVK